MHHLAHAGLPRGVGDPHGADHVDRRIELRVGHRVAHVDLSGQVEHHLRLVLAEDGRQIGGDDVRLDEGELGGVDQVLEIGGPPGGVVVQTDDACARRSATGRLASTR